jgi:molybdate transport system substrate-binding protein
MLHELARPEFDTIALANPRMAPLGRYSQQALERIGLWPEIAPRCVFGAHARQVLDYVARGEVAAGIVYVTDPPLAAAQVAAGPPLPGELHDPIVYEGVVIGDSPRADEARELLLWLAGEEGGAFLLAHGFAPPA